MTLERIIQKLVNDIPETDISRAILVRITQSIKEAYHLGRTEGARSEREYPHREDMGR